MAIARSRRSHRDRARSRGDRRPGLTLRLVLARAVLAWETFWPPFWPALGVAGLFLALALLDVLPLLHGWLHAATLAAFAAAFLLALWRGARGLRLPRVEQAERRLEQDSALQHRPLAALHDRLATDPRDHAATLLWEAHRRRLLAQAARLRLGLPRAGLARVDPLALRAALVLLLAVAAAAAWYDWPQRLASALKPQLAARAESIPSRLDAWINPPAYTGVAPLFLGPQSPGDTPIQVPVGSTVLAQVQGDGGPPQLWLGEAASDFTPVTTGVYKISTELEGGDRLAITQDGATLAEWPLEVVPDAPPVIDFLGPPGRTERSALRLDYGAADDYGLTAVEAEIRRIDRPELEPLRLELVLPGVGLRQAENSSYHDLTPHPWAGLAVTIRLTARDALDQTGETETLRTVLPERIFNHPVARALVELRRQLTLNPDKRFPVVRGLRELSQRPEHFFDDIVVFLALQSAERRLVHDRDAEAVAEVQQLMWDTALRIEEGDLAIAERELREIQEALMRALAEGASDEEIERLMDQLREAMDRFLEALAEQLSKELAEGAEPQPLPPNAQMLESQDLHRLLERARELAKTGSRDAARELLSQLQNLLENLRANPMGQFGQDGENAWEMMRDMEEMMMRQQELLDRSYQRAQERGRPGEQNERGEMGAEGEGRPSQRPGEAGRRSENQLDAKAQEEIRRRLGEMMRRLGEALGDIPRPLGRAEQAMRDARDALTREQPTEAIDPQSRALDQLQQGMQAMADRFMEQMGQGQNQRGQGQVGMEPGFGRDPLGRQMGDNGLEALEGVEIPEQMELRRAREILDELRRRRGEPTRPPLELDYIDRLLQQF